MRDWVAIGISGGSLAMAALALARGYLADRRERGASLWVSHSPWSSSTDQGNHLTVLLRNDGPGAARDVSVTFRVRTKGRFLVPLEAPYMPGALEKSDAVERVAEFVVEVPPDVVSGPGVNTGRRKTFRVTYRWRDDVTRFRRRKRTWRSPYES